MSHKKMMTNDKDNEYKYNVWRRIAAACCYDNRGGGVIPSLVFRRQQWLLLLCVCVCIYLVWRDVALLCHHSSQARQGTKERYSQPHTQIPLTLRTEHQGHTHRPVEQIEGNGGSAFSCVCMFSGGKGWKTERGTQMMLWQRSDLAYIV